MNYFTGLAKGEIASLFGAADDARYFQISGPVQPGNSGGALVDDKGNVVGIVAAKVLARGHQCGHGVGGERGVARERELRTLAPSLSHRMGEGVRRTGEGASWNRCQAWRPS